MKKKILLFLIVFSFFILYSYKLSESFFYNPDFARDLYDISRITQGKLTLIGPKLTFGGIYSGPYYYYLFTPIFFLTKLNLNAILYFNVFLFAAALGYFFKKSYEKNSLVLSVLTTSVIALLPLWIISARNPSNAFTYLAILLILLTYIYYHSVQNKLQLSIIGFFVGVITTFHLINLTIVPFIFLFLFSQVQKKYNILFFVFGFLFAFAPLLLFEIKHNFVMFTNTFIHKSYEKWVTNTNIPGGLAGKKNILENIVFISDLMKQYILFSPIVYFVGMLLLYSRKLRGREVLLALFAFGSFLFLAATMRFQFIAHYMFPVAFFLFFATITVLLRTKYIMVLILFLIIGIANFPQHLYEKSQRSAEPFEKAVRYVVDNRIIKKGERFNVIQITKQNLLATIAFEYRFFFNKMGYRPDSEFEYNRSKTLIVFSELPDYNISQFSSWEVDQFGKEYFRSAQKYRNEELTIYKVVK